jgi:hypothetical protein
MSVSEWRPTPGCSVCLNILKHIVRWSATDLKHQVDLVVAQGMPASQADVICPECSRVYSPARVLADRRHHQEPSHGNERRAERG